MRLFTSLTICLGNTVITKLDSIVKINTDVNLSRSAIIQEAVDAWLKEYDKKEKNAKEASLRDKE